MEPTLVSRENAAGVRCDVAPGNARPFLKGAGDAIHRDAEREKQTACDNQDGEKITNGEVRTCPRHDSPSARKEKDSAKVLHN